MKTIKINGLFLRILVAVFVCSIFRQSTAQIYDLDYKQWIKDNSEITISVDTMHCDTTVKKDFSASCDLNWPRDTSYGVVTISTSIICNVTMHNGLNVIVNEDGQRQSIGFVRVKYGYSNSKHRIVKGYIRCGFWVYYTNGQLLKVVTFKKGRSKSTSFLQLHSNGSIYVLRICNKSKVYTEVYDQAGKKMETGEDYEKLLFKLSSSSINNLH